MGSGGSKRFARPPQLRADVRFHGSERPMQKEIFGVESVVVTAASRGSLLSSALVSPGLQSSSRGFVRPAARAPQLRRRVENRACSAGATFSRNSGAARIAANVVTQTDKLACSAASRLSSLSRPARLRARAVGACRRADSGRNLTEPCSRRRARGVWRFESFRSPAAAEGRR